MPSRLTSRAIARKWGISAREAHKHFVARTTPDGRKRSRPGAAEVDSPPSVEPRQLFLLPDMVLAREAVQRLAGAEEFSDDDLEALRAMIAAANLLLKDWQETVARVEAGL